MKSNVWKSQSERESLPVFKVLSSWLWYHVTWEINTDISKEPVAFILWMEAVGSSVIWVLTYQTTWHHIQNDSIFIVPAMRTRMFMCCHIQFEACLSLYCSWYTYSCHTWVRTSQVINSVVSSSQFATDCLPLLCFTLLLSCTSRVEV